MPVPSGQCPNCGAEVAFRSGDSMSLVCAYCRHVAVRTDRGLEKLGTVSEVAPSEHSLIVGDRGSVGGRDFEVLGRVELKHLSGGTWEEYYVSFGAQGWGWIATAQGRWYLTSKVDVRVSRVFTSLAAGDEIVLGNYGRFTVGEVNAAPFSTAGGELPFVTRPGDLRRFADLSGANGAWATIDFSDTGSRHDVFVGRVITRDELNLRPRPEGSVASAGARVPLAGIVCPNCGGALPARSSTGIVRVVCPYCAVLSDLETHELIARQEDFRGGLKIPLGSRGELHGIAWVVIGYMVRASVIDAELFEWSEYLLYSESKGYRWVIEDEGNWYFAREIEAGEIDLGNFPQGLRFGGRHFVRRNENTARVVSVLGEFYWKVSVGESVLATDFECGQTLISRESAGSEIHWTVALVESPRVLFPAFGLPVPSAPWKVESYQPAKYSGDPSWWSQYWWVVVIALMALFVISSLADDDGSTGGGHGTFIGVGGFGGK